MYSIPAYHADEALRLANERLDGLRAESAMLRLAASGRPAKPSLTALSVLRSAVASVRSAVTVIEADVRPVTPALNDYPYRA